jgi:hypothetical protein
MRIRLFWAWSNGALEALWEGEYKPQRGTAFSHWGAWPPDANNDHLPRSTIRVQIDGRRVIVRGSTFTGGEQIGTIWRQDDQILEVEFFAGL